jgi:integrase
MAHKNLNDRILKSLKPASAGKVDDYWDKGFPGFGVRVSEKGRKTFVLMARYPGSTNPTRRALGVYDAISLADAREKARGWLKLIDKNLDPAQEEERQRLVEDKKRKNTFAAVAEDFIAEKLPSERSRREAERDIRRIFVAAWGGRPIIDITDLDVLAIIREKKKTAPVRAKSLLLLLKRFFTWAIDQRVYQLHSSPCDRIKPKSIYESVPRQRELADAELAALWRAIDGMQYPYGPVYRLLLLAGLRLNEVADAQWSEFDSAVVKALRQRKADEPINWASVSNRQLKWTIPKERMKGRNNRARAHAVPLTAEILEVLETLPMFERGNYVFSTSAGASPAYVGNNIKKALDGLMLAALQEQAKADGEEPGKVRLQHWTNHDLRRVIRSGMSRLRVPDAVAESILAHTQGVIAKTYNVDDLFDQKAEALAAWADHLKTIPPLRPKAVSVRAVYLAIEEAEASRASFAQRLAKARA